MLPRKVVSHPKITSLRIVGGRSSGSALGHQRENKRHQEVVAADYYAEASAVLKSESVTD